MSNKKKSRKIATRQNKTRRALPKVRRYESLGAIRAAKCSFEKTTITPGTTSGSAPKGTPNKGSVGYPRKATRSDNNKDEACLMISIYPNAMQRACRFWFENIFKLGLRGIRKEFLYRIKPYKIDTTKDVDLISAFCDPANTEKNRYDDIYLLDRTRVKIKINPEDDDYIHASFVEVRPDLTYICSQGPLENTIHQFWLMCIQEDVKVILQSCKNIEDEKEKCCNYIPIGSEAVKYGCVEVKVLKVDVVVPAAMKLCKSIIQCKFGNKTIILTHFLYTGWPDHTVAENPSTCRIIRSLVQKFSEKKPIVIHCSAGIGRTGSFVAMEMICNKLLNELKGDFSMVDLMRDLRNQRALAIQNDQQYSFIFRCMLEILIAEGGLMRTPELNAFIESYENLVERKKKAGI